MHGAFSILDSLLAPGANSGEQTMSDRAEQAGYVLEGELTLWVEGEADSVTLRQGDSFHLASFAHCRYGNLTDLPARVLWVYN
jgi:quercetin dioxygenase-like cupin family protein